MSDFQSRQAAKLADLNQRIAEIDGRLAELSERRKDNSLAACQGTKSSIQLIAAGDAESDKLARERMTLASAIEAAEQLAKDEQAEVVRKTEQARHKQARELSGTVAVYNEEIDKLLVQLREVLERRVEALHSLSRTDVVDRMLVNRMLGKDALTRALQYHAIHHFAAIMAGAPSSAAPMSQANQLLAGFGAGYIEPGKVARVKLNE